MDKEISPKETRAKVEKLLAGAKVVYLATNGANGHPNVRAMTPMKTRGADTVWFATSLESSKVIELVKDSKSALFGHSGASEFRLWGTVSILDDRDSRKLVWNDDLKKTYGDVTSPVMRVLRFDAVSGSYAKEGRSGSFSL